MAAFGPVCRRADCHARQAAERRCCVAWHRFGDDAGPNPSRMRGSGICDDALMRQRSLTSLLRVLVLSRRMRGPQRVGRRAGGRAVSRDPDCGLRWCPATCPRLAIAGGIVTHGHSASCGSRGCQEGISAITRSGLPEPRSSLSGGQTMIVPVGGSWSRFVRHCSP